MAKVVNLRTARKQRARDEDRRKGDRAAARTGGTAAEAERTRAEAALERRRLDAHRRDEPEG
jgi:hypothetical protein